VAGEPLADALRVEGVAALGQQPEPLLVLELAEADGALERAALPDPQRPGLGVLHGGERLDHRGVEPAGAPLPPRARDEGVEVGGGGAVVVAPERVAGAVAEVDGEEGDEDEHRDDGGEERDHGLADVHLAGHVVIVDAGRRGLRAGRGERGREQRGEQRTAMARRGHPSLRSAPRQRRWGPGDVGGLTSVSAQHEVWSRAI